MKPINLYLPAPLTTITQGFGANENPSYHADGLKGHAGCDFGLPYGSPLYACIEGYVYSIMNKGAVDPSKYQAIYQLVDGTDGYAYEVSYGHLSAIKALPGDYVKVGQIIGSTGNSGPVYANGVAVTVAERLAGSHAGQHLHFQVRKCRKVVSTIPSGHYLQSGDGILYEGGYYYEVLNWESGYNGCVNPADYWNNTLAKNAPQLVSLYSRVIPILRSLLSLVKKN